MAGENQQRGMVCPNPKCGQKNFVVVGRRHPMRGVRIRYFCCRSCGTRWKSSERFIAILN